MEDITIEELRQEKREDDAIDAKIELEMRSDFDFFLDKIEDEVGELNDAFDRVRTLLSEYGWEDTREEVINLID